jgi:hypothetical protein
VVKAVDPAQFRVAIDGFGLLPYWGTSLVAVIVPWVEIVAACMVLTRARWWRGAVGCLAALLVIFLGVLIYAKVMGLNPDCGCFGVASHGVMAAIWRDLALLVLVGAVFIADRRALHAQPATALWPCATAYVAIVAAVGVTSFWGVAAPAPRAVHTPPIATVREPQPTPADPVMPARRLVPVALRQSGGDMTMPEQRQIALESVLQAGVADRDVREYLRRHVGDRSWDDLSRHLAVGILLLQPSAVPGLAQQLAEQAVDARETPRWRDYAVQWMAHVAGREVDPQPTIDTLVRLAAQPGEETAGTALLGLQQLARDGRWTWDAQSEGVIPRVADDPHAPQHVRMTAMMLIGERQMAAALPIVRQYAQNEDDPHLRRVALRALGSLGDASDEASLQEGLASGNMLVASAARHGYQALQQRLAMSVDQRHTHTSPTHER